MLSPPLLAMIAGLMLSLSGLLPPHSGVYDAVWQYLVPTAVGLFLLEADFKG
jgi:uncharacterized membrane protein